VHSLDETSQLGGFEDRRKKTGKSVRCQVG
jgi:hypothetical protein